MADHSPATSGAGNHIGEQADEHGPSHGIGHVAPLGALLSTGLALLVLTWITVAVSKIDLGEANIFIALGVAVLKATLVALYFMHLRWDRPFNAILLVGSLVFVALFLSFTMMDSRAYRPDLITGDAPAVVDELGKIPPP